MIHWLILSFLLVAVSVVAEEASDQAEVLIIDKEVKAIHDLAGQGKMDEAITRLDTLIKNLPQSTPLKLQYDLANLLFLQGRYREARAAYQRVILISQEQSEWVTHAKERIAKMKERETKKRDEVAIQLIDIETVLDAGQLPPPGSKEFLKKLEKEETSPHRDAAESLMKRIHQREDEKVKEVLNEARRLFDEGKNYFEVMSLLESIQRDYPETEETPSVRILKEETERRIRRSGKTYVPSLQEER